MKYAVMFVLCAMSMLGCGSTTPRPETPDVPPGHQADAPPPAAAPDIPDGGPNLSMNLPDGWSQAPAEMVPAGVAGVLINPSLGAVILVLIDTSGSEPAATIAALVGQLTGEGGWTASAVRMSPDGSTASATIDDGAGTRGDLIARRLRASPAVSLILMGRWPTASEAAATADIEAMAAGATLH